jgi:2,4-dienoyl-CoA reductase-like NADH-dependent reductase (Old Yellow Enzyme family)
MPTLFDPITIGAIEAHNRIIMAPLTRARATRNAVPTPIMADYYAQRASAGLIISEATGISRIGLGWPFAPGLWNQDQVDGWKPVTKAVHDAGGRIVVQLWHMGRIVHPSVGGGQPVSSSAITAPDYAHTYEGKQPHVEPRSLDISEIPALLEDYAQAARNAVAAGFDGVQIHAANGYLIDQFLRDGANRRSDAYGGSIENRTRLLGEVTRAVAGAIGAERTGVRLSPNGEMQGVNDSDPHSLFAAAGSLLSDIGIAFLEAREPGPDSNFSKPSHAPVAPVLRKVFGGPFILNSDYDAGSGQAVLDSGVADAIAFGRPFISNPDLPARFREGLPLATPDVKTFYTQGGEGYIDYPAVA